MAILTEAARVMRPEGRLLVVDMYCHDREEYKQQMGHVWLGFSEEKMQEYFLRAGFQSACFHPLPPDADARGPELFAASAKRAAPGLFLYNSESEVLPRGRARPGFMEN